MDVVCGRCKAEYEFDDALISERGTTVRCTNCGLQFKVFPSSGSRVPELWTVHPAAGGDVLSYESLAELQRAITKGRIGSHDLLARGEEAPRSFSSIPELQPLLRQPLSSSPEPDGSSSSLDEPAQDVTSQEDAAGSFEESMESHADSIGDDEIVPSQPPEPIEGADDAAADSTLDSAVIRPRIQSVLSIAPGPDAADADTAPSSPRQGRSLRAALGTIRPSAETAPAAENMASEATLDVSWGTGTTGAESTLDVGSAELANEPSTQGQSSAGAFAPTLDARAIVQDQDRAQAAVAPTRAPSLPPMHMGAEPTITDSADSPRALTPTPTQMRALRTPESRPLSSIPGAPQPRRARSGLIVLVVLGCVGAGLTFFAGDRISAVLRGMGKTAEDETSASSAEPLSSEERAEVQSEDLEWLRVRLRPGDEGLRRSAEQRIDALLAIVAKDHAPGWSTVNLYRMAGRLDEARGLLDKLEGADPYALAMLDLAETGSERPWPSILERLKEASTGERGSFRARSAHIYALAEAGRLPEARLDFEALGRLQGAAESPLYRDLGDYLQDEKRSAPRPAASSKPRPKSKTPQVSPQAATQPPAAEPSVPPAAKTAQPAAKPAPARPKPPAVSDAVKAKVVQADSLWAGGDRDAAVAVYRQVVAEIGTSHFLGVRSASRIRQAEREAAGQ